MQEIVDVFSIVWRVVACIGILAIVWIISPIFFSGFTIWHSSPASMFLGRMFICFLALVFVVPLVFLHWAAPASTASSTSIPSAHLNSESISSAPGTNISSNRLDLAVAAPVTQVTFPTAAHPPSSTALNGICQFKSAATGQDLVACTDPETVRINNQEKTTFNSMRSESYYPALWNDEKNWRRNLLNHCEDEPCMRGALLDRLNYLAGIRAGGGAQALNEPQ